LSDPLQIPSDNVTRVKVKIEHRIGALKIDVDFELTKPWTLLFGPSGSGKTTILRVIAGLLKPDRGHVVCTAAAQSVTLLDTATGVFVPAHQRRIRLAAQQPNLFPHMSVEQNLLYGFDGAHSGRDKMPEAMWNGFGLSQILRSLPKNISGGEAHRVNLARAVAATGSRMLLFDEPFTGMDASRRDQLLPWLRNMLARERLPVLSVTHDVAEAFQLGAEVIQIDDGRVIRLGRVEVVLAEERARLLGQLDAGYEPPASTEPFLSG
jgi:molybdate transport system ATP-binding protein